MDHTCKNCGNIHTGKYCNQCGQKVYDKRFTVKQTIYSFIRAVININSGLLYTLYSTYIRPHVVISEYISGATRKYTNPALFALYLLTFSFILMAQTDFYDANLDSFNEKWGINNNEQPAIAEYISLTIKNNQQYLMLLIVPFFALISRWLYKRYNYAEHLILHFYIFSAAFLIPSILVYVTNGASFNNFVAIPFLIVFYTYAFRRTFRGSVFSSLMKVILFYISGYIMAIIVLIVLIILIAMLKLWITGSL